MSVGDDDPPFPPPDEAAPTDANEVRVRGGRLKMQGRPVDVGGRPKKRKRGKRPGHLRAVDGDAPPDTDDWRGLLTVDEGKGGTAKSLHNAIVILTHDPRWQGVLGYDERGDRGMFLREPPFAPDYAGRDRSIPREIRDADAARTAMWIEREHEVSIGVKTINDALNTAILQNPFELVRDYLSGLTWDGTPRTDTWLSTFLGAAETAYTRAVGARWLISAVARTFEPGCKADCVLTLEGRQGIKKSTALRVLASPQFFTDQIPDLSNKDARLQIVGKWIIELSELDTLSRAEVGAIKAFLSQPDDRYRSPYGRRTEDHPRRCIFAGTTNLVNYLRDDTGNRRFWPVACGERIDVEGLAAARDQLWAEATARYRAGDRWYLDTEELVAVAAEEQEKRYQGDEWEAVIEQYVATPPTATESVLPLWKVLGEALKIDRGKWTMADQVRAGRAMTRLGWTKKRAPRDGTGVRGWVYARPVVQVNLPGPPSPHGPGNASNPAAGPSGLGGPGDLSIHARARVNARAGDGSVESGRSTQTTRTTQTTELDFRSEALDFPDAIDPDDFHDGPPHPADDDEAPGEGGR